METEVGIITALKDAFGFIACKGYAKDVFFHRDDLDGLEFGPHLLHLNVTFAIREAPKGPRAYQVRAAD